MPVFDHLAKITSCCTFNGYLADYLKTGGTEDGIIREAFTQIAKDEPDIRICAGLSCAVSKVTVSNMKYSDITRVSPYPVVVPYILYLRSRGLQRALVILPEEPYCGLYAKGLFYCLTEQGSLFEEDRNELATITAGRVRSILFAVENLFLLKASVLQRRLDTRSFTDYDLLLRDAVNASRYLCKMVQESRQNGEKPDMADAVRRWYYLKKLVYVQYLMNKEVLEHVHNGDRKEQRKQARQYSERICTLPYTK